MKLTNENYFSVEALTEYMSTSQFKAFEQCEAKAFAELQGWNTATKQAYKEGHYFEACILGEDRLFLLDNPDMISSRGATKGMVKSSFQNIQHCAEVFLAQPLFKDIIERSKPQVIVTGEIAGIKFKGCVDFLDEDFNGYDTKCMKDFKKVYSETEQMYINWYFAYGYHYQAAIYRELIYQTYGKVGQQHILAVTKEEIPDVTAFHFTDEILDNAIEIIKEYAPHYNRIKKGIIEPSACGKCDYCKQTKILTEFDIVGEYE